MKKILREVGLAFLVAGVLGMVIDAIIKHSLPTLPKEFWIFFVAFGLGIVLLFLSHFWNQIFTSWERFKVKYLLIKETYTRRLESIELLRFKDDQQKHPEKWLYPVINIIDLNVQGLVVNDVYVRFQIDSHLLFEIKEFYVFARLCLAPDCVHSNESEWYEIKKPENYAPIGRLVRYDFSDIIHLVGEIVGEMDLQDWLNYFRNEGEKN